MAQARLHLLDVDPVIVDDHPPAEPGTDVLAFDHGGRGALRACDVIVKSPGVSRYRPEVAAMEAEGVEVVGGVGLWMEEVDRSRVVCVTGTKGKSTTVSVMGHLLERLG